MRRVTPFLTLVTLFALTACAGTGFPALKVTIPTPLGPAVLDSCDVTSVVTEPLGVTDAAPASEVK